MALPGELRQLLLRRISFLLRENWPVELLALCYTPHEVKTFNSPSLLQREKFLQTAAWLGEVGYTNQLFLPADLSLLTAAAANQLEVFLDNLLRGNHYTLVANAILRNLRSIPETASAEVQERVQAENNKAETMFCYLIARNNSLAIDPDLLIDDLLLNRVYFSKRFAKFLLAVSGDYSFVSVFRQFLEGFVFAQEHKTLPGDFIGQGNESYPLMGYLLGGGTKYANIEFARYYRVVMNSLARLNLTPKDIILTVTATTEPSLLAHLAYRLIKVLPKTGNREFPSVTISLMAPELLRERAAPLIQLIPLIYQNSPARESYLKQLAFILSPQSWVGNSNEIPHSFLIIFGRAELLASMDFDRSVNADAEYLEDPTQVVNQLIRSLVLRKQVAAILARAVFTQQLPGFATKLFDALARAKLPIPSRLEGALENFNEGVMNSKTTALRESFVVGWLQNEITIDVNNVSFSEIQPRQDRRQQDLQYQVIFHYQNVSFFARTTAYGFQTWRELFPALQGYLKNVVDPTILRAQILLARLAATSAN